MTPPTVNGKVWTFAGQIERVIDADTVVVKLLIDTGHDETLTRTRTIRILGINAPEKSTPEGKAALAWAAVRWAVGSPVVVEVVGYDKYGGRDDGNVRSLNGAFDWARDMLAAGMAVPYDGGKR